MKKATFINFNSQTSIFQQIVDEIKRQIIVGEFKENDFLLSVREFAITHTINPNTVAKAYQILQNMNWVESVRGRGIQVKKLKEKIALNEKNQILTEKIKDLFQTAQSLGVSKEEIFLQIKNFGRKQ